MKPMKKLVVQNEEYEVVDEFSRTITKGMFIQNETQLEEAINNPYYKTYYLGSFDVNEPISITDNRAANKLTFVGGHITLNSVLFTNPSLPENSRPWAIPSFVGTYFEKGTHNTLIDTGFYTLFGTFNECHFINVSFINGSKCIQSLRFNNCYFIADANTPTFINANAIYDCKFINCDLESNFVPMLINVEKDLRWGGGIGSTMRQLSFINCVSEGRTNVLVQYYIGDVSFVGHYAEANSAPLVNVLYDANVQTYHEHYISFINSFLSASTPNDLIVKINKDKNYENTSFVCIGCQINGCTLVNTNKFLRYVVDGCSVIAGAIVPPSKVMSRVSYADYSADSISGNTFTNGLAFFKLNTRTIYITPRLTMLSFMSSYQGKYQTFVLIAGASSPSNALGSPFVYCISHPSLTFTIEGRSDDGVLEITIPSTVGTLQYTINMSATDMQGIFSSATKEEYYRGKARNGFNPREYGTVSNFEE